MRTIDWGTWGTLFGAAALETIGNLAPKERSDTDRLVWLVAGLTAYGLALPLFARLLGRAKLAAVFALWVGVAAVLIALLKWLLFEEPLSPRRLAGPALVVCGMLLLEV